MIDQFIADKSDFKKKTILLLVLIFFSLFGWILLNNYRLDITQQKVKAFETSQQQAAWLEKFDYKANQEVLKHTLDLVPLKKVEEVQRTQLDIFRRHHLNLINIQNGEVKTKTGKKSKSSKEKQLNFVQSSATVTGSWDDLIACLNDFEQQHLVVITDCRISNEKTGLISAVLRYRIYHE